MNSLEQARLSFTARGELISDWARARGFQRNDVYAVLSGRLKGNTGKGHLIAVALGIKEHESGMSPQQPTTGAEERKT